MPQQHSTQRIDADIWASQQVERAITALRQATGALGDDGGVAEVEAHAVPLRAWSDERLKETGQALEGALAALREMSASVASDAEVEAHAYIPAFSDERLKETVQAIEGALAALRDVSIEPGPATRPAVAPLDDALRTLEQFAEFSL
jgi:hypothetical protein